MEPKTQNVKDGAAVAGAAACSALATKLLNALHKLTKECVPHPCGGFTTDDIEWRMGTAFTGEEALTSALDELQESKLIRYAGYDEGDAMHHCYALSRGSAHGCHHCDSAGGEKTYANQACIPLDGKVVCVDWCIHHIVAALNAGGVKTVACCCGHGDQRGRIDLSDGRVLYIENHLKSVSREESPPRKPCPLCGKIEADGELHAAYRCDGAMQQLADMLRKPACKGINCRCADGINHSPECRTEHDALCNDAAMQDHINHGGWKCAFCGYDGQDNQRDNMFCAGCARHK